MTPTPRAARSQPGPNGVGPGEACGTGTEGRAGWGDLDDLHPTHLVLRVPGDEFRPLTRWCRTCGTLVYGHFLGLTPASDAPCGTYAEPGVWGLHHAVWAQ